MPCGYYQIPEIHEAMSDCTVGLQNRQSLVDVEAGAELALRDMNDFVTKWHILGVADHGLGLPRYRLNFIALPHPPQWPVSGLLANVVVNSILSDISRSVIGSKLNPDNEFDAIDTQTSRRRRH